MRQFDQAGSLGALLLGSALLGYAIFQLVLLPNAGFPSDEVEVILAGASTLRIGHWLKFADALALALLVVAMHARLRSVTPVLAQLATIGGVSAATLFLASGLLGLRILAVAELTYPVNPTEAVTTIYLRTVTVALFDAAISAAGFFGLLFNLGGLLTRRLPRTVYIPGIAFGALFLVNSVLSYELTLIAVVLAMVWSFWLSAVLWREATSSESLLPVRA